MNRLIVALVALFSIVLSPVVGFAQDATPAAEEPDFFATQPGYVGGAQVNFAADEVSADILLICGGGVAQFDTEENGKAAMTSVRTEYLAFLTRENDIGYDFTGIGPEEDPFLGDEAAIYSGTTVGSEGNPDFNFAVIFVRQGDVVFGVQGLSLLGDPIAFVQPMAEAILARDPQLSALPLDGSNPDADIWQWLPTYTDVGEGYTMDDRAWTTETGKETTFDLLPVATPTS